MFFGKKRVARDGIAGDEDRLQRMKEAFERNKANINLMKFTHGFLTTGTKGKVRSSVFYAENVLFYMLSHCDLLTPFAADGALSLCQLVATS